MPSKTKTHTQYKIDDEKLPGVTTITDLATPKEPLMSWACEQGKKGLDWRKVRDSAGDIGTLSHYLILCDLKNISPEVTEYSQQHIDEAKTRLLKWWDWKKEHTLEPLFIETPMVSSVHRFGGTPDYVGYIDEKQTIMDIKTGKGIYDEYWYQVVAYGEMVKCTRLMSNPEVELNIFDSIDEYILLWLSPDTTKKAETKTLLDGTLYWQGFLYLLGFYWNRKQLKGEK